MGSKKKISVIDFFCGGGGFSEGFRQAGFDVVWAVDLWQPAVDTHNENHPETKAVRADVIKLSLLPDDEFEKLIPDSEVIIGSPPCTAFSNSNKSGNGDKAKGIMLFEAYLRIIARKKYKKDSKLKYWILENVPKIQTHIQEKYSAKQLNLQGDFELHVKGGYSGVYNAKYFGVPSNRERFFCGEFPEPVKTITKDDDLIPLKTILTALGAPKQKLHAEIIDPLYGFRMNGADVTDHHYIQEIAEFEWQKAKRLKQDKGYMGKMSFPENLDKPSRTIMATMSVSARESFILSNGKGKYRVPTIREIACLMSFPIDYRFFGSSSGTKYKLVGNAVPPRLSYAFARAIASKEMKDIDASYSRIEHRNEVDFINLNLDTFHVNHEKPKKSTSKFKYHVPYFVFNAYRVELTNGTSNFKNENFDWRAAIHYGQGKRANVYVPDISSLNLSKKDIEISNSFVKQIKNHLRSFNEFQNIYCLTDKERNTLIGPYQLLNQIRTFIDSHFKFSNDEPFVRVEFNEMPEFPRPILIGYYILYNCIEKMKSLSHE